MLIFSNTFDECQADKSSSPFLPLCLSLSFTYSPLLLRPCFRFGAEMLENQWVHPHSVLWIIEYSSAHCVVTSRPCYRESEQWEAVCSQLKTAALCNVCNDKRQSAFRVPAFIIVNVDDTGLLPSWQTVTELSGTHNHWLCTAMITFKTDECQPFGIVSCCAGWQSVYACMCMHTVCLSAPGHWIQMQEFVRFGTDVCQAEAAQPWQ